MTDKQKYHDDGRFLVTSELVSTPNRFYPLANTTAKIRRDPLWFALGLSAINGAATAIYGDLLQPQELAWMWGVNLAVFAAGWSVSILNIEAIGHKSTILFARTGTVKKLFAAIKEARMAQFHSKLPPESIEAN